MISSGHPIYNSCETIENMTFAGFCAGCACPAPPACPASIGTDEDDPTKMTNCDGLLAMKMFSSCHCIESALFAGICNGCACGGGDAYGYGYGYGMSSGPPE